MPARYKVIESSSHPSEGDMDAQYKLGFELVTVAAWKDGGVDRFFATYRYTGARRMPGNLIA